MNKLVHLALLAGCVLGCTASRAETPAANPMPDGSRDMYAGLGLQSAPRYEGTGSRKLSALPVLQAEWSNGLFVSGLTAGIHLSSRPALEFGPLLAVLPGRRASGTAGAVGGIGVTAFVGSPDSGFRRAQADRLGGMDDIGARLQGGGFLNFYLDPAWRLTSSLLYGSGSGHDGARLELGVQRLAAALGEHHRVALAAGLTLADRKDNQTWFGVTPEESARSRFSYYDLGGGARDLHLDARWNWSWTPSCMPTTDLRATRLLGSAAHSPLVERSSNLAVTSAIAYRF